MMRCLKTMRNPLIIIYTWEFFKFVKKNDISPYLGRVDLLSYIILKTLNQIEIVL